MQWFARSSYRPPCNGFSRRDSSREEITVCLCDYRITGIIPSDWGEGNTVHDGCEKTPAGKRRTNCQPCTFKLTAAKKDGKRKILVDRVPTDTCLCVLLLRSFNFIIVTDVWFVRWAFGEWNGTNGFFQISWKREALKDLECVVPKINSSLTADCERDVLKMIWIGRSQSHLFFENKTPFGKTQLRLGCPHKARAVYIQWTCCTSSSLQFSSNFQPCACVAKDISVSWLAAISGCRTYAQNRERWELNVLLYSGLALAGVLLNAAAKLTTRQ